MVQVNGSTGDGGQLERRFRFSCKANVADASNVKVALDKEQTRVCHSDGSCQRYGTSNLSAKLWNTYFFNLQIW